MNHAASKAISTGSRQSPRAVFHDRLTALALIAAFLLLYVSTLCPTVFWYDSAEYAAAAATLGIPHPPGYPLYTMVGKLFTLLPMEPAHAVNLMSAVFGALAVALCFALGRRIGASRIGAFIGAATLGAGDLFWSQAIIAEVYTFGLTVVLAVVLLLVHGLQRDRAILVVGAAWLAGLGLGVHLFIATCGLGLVLLVWGIGLPTERPVQLRQLCSRQALRRRVGVLAACGVATLLGACIFLYIPWRASMHPPLNFEDPSTWYRFKWFVTGGPYKNWFLEHYAWTDRAGRVALVFYDQLLAVGMVLVPIGLWRLWRTRPLFAVAFPLMIVGNVYFFFNYDVHDLEVFFLPSIALSCCLVGLGVDAAVALVARLTGGSPRSALIRRGVAFVLLLFPISLVLAYYDKVDLSGYVKARDYAEAICTQLPPHAVIVTFTMPPEWKDDAVFSMYYQKVLNRRPDVSVLSRLSPQDVRVLLARDVPVYMYYPNPHVTALFEVPKEGVLYHITKAIEGTQSVQKWYP